MTEKAPRLTDIKLHQQSKMLELTFDDGQNFNLSCEFLRVYSPSAEVQGHGPGQEVLQIGKENVNITAVESIGNYAIKLDFDDGHNTGIYSWETLHRLGSNHDALWLGYLDRLEKAGHTRKGK